METSGANPFTALRYVIMQHIDSEELVFHFGISAIVDHAALEVNFINDNGAKWKAVVGGFYVLKRNDTNSKFIDGVMWKTLHLFDISTKFSFDHTTFNFAMPKLIEDMKKFKTEVTHEYGF